MEREAALHIDIGPTYYEPKTTSTIPQEVTQGILRNEQLPSELPPLQSSVIEDFIVKQITSGVSDSDQIVEAFFAEDIPRQIEATVADTRRIAEDILWNETFTHDDAQKTQQKIVAILQEVRLTQEQQDQIAATEIYITETIGISSIEDNAIYISKLQAVRRAMDYKKVFKDNIALATIVRAIITSRIGHELGHKIDHVTETTSNSMPMDWMGPEGHVGSNAERFAESWGRMVLEDATEQAVVQKEWVLQVAKVNEVWKAIQASPEPVDITAIFNGLQKDSLLSKMISKFSSMLGKHYSATTKQKIMQCHIKLN